MNAPDAGGVAVTTYPARGAGERIVASSPSPALTPVPAQRRVDVELLRVAAAVMVVTIHVTSQVLIVPAADRGVTYWLALVAGEGSRAAVPIFFAISGWLLLTRPDPGDGRWLRTRLARLGLPLLAWSAIYVLEGLVTGHGGAAPLDWLGRQLVVTATGPGTRGHLWYLYVAIALTVAIWAVRAAAAGRFRDRASVAVAGAALTGSMGLAAAVGTTATWTGVAWALGYAVVGYALLTAEPRRVLGAVTFALSAAALIVATAVVGYDKWPSFYQSPLVVGMTVGLLWMVSGLDVERWRAPLARASSLTLGVYLVHVLVLDVVAGVFAGGKPFAAVSPFPRLPLTWIAVLVVSFALVALWHRSARLTALLG